MIDPKELIPVKLKDLTDHLREEGSAVVYLRNGNNFSRCDLRSSDTEEIRQITLRYINRGMLFIRRNRPFKSGV